MTGPGPVTGGMKSSPAGRAGIQAVSLFGPKFGVGATCPASPAASAGHDAPMPQRSAARRALLTVGFGVFIDERLDMERFLVRQLRKYSTSGGTKRRGLRAPHRLQRFGVR